MDGWNRNSHEFRYLKNSVESTSGFESNMKRNTFHFAIRLLYMAVAAALANGALGDPVELRVMSFNIRFSKVDHSEAATENNWADAKFPRRNRAIRVIHEQSPDLLGVQEALELQIDDL